MASRGAPVSECSPSTTQLLLPHPSVDPSVTTAAAQERRQPAERLAEALQLRALTGGVRRPLRVAGTALLGVLLEDSVDHGALADDRPVGLVVVVGVELGKLLRRVVGGHQGPLDLLVEVALEVPRHRLEPGQRVDGRPRLRPVVETAEAEHGVLHRDLRGAVRVEVGVDSGGVGVERRARARCEQRQLLLGDPAPAERADRTCRPPGCLTRTAQRGGRTSRGAGSPSRRTAPARARNPARPSGRPSCRRTAGGCRGRP